MLDPFGLRSRTQDERHAQMGYCCVIENHYQFYCIAES